ncbi:MAG: hypothetical protein K6F00_05980, partial [Lachnospiraceae bacterium]|nr:hypothetical protein [Lachnospiraceae bacterium]
YYNRKVQGDYADYVIVMAYDEHYTGSEEAGSNSSAPYVKMAVEGTTEEVPAERVILGLPFYAREFVSNEEGLTNTAIAMNKIPDYIKKHDLEPIWLDNEEQYYVEYTDETGGLHSLWIEDSKSLARKMCHIKDDGLAGGAFWKAGFEDASIWDVIAGYIN